MSSSSTASGVDAGVEAAVRISQGYCIYAGCFPINVIPPPLSLVFDVALSQGVKHVPAIAAATGADGGDRGWAGRGTHSGGLPGHGFTSARKSFDPLSKVAPMKFNTATAWIMGDGIGAPYAVGEAASQWFDAATQLGQARSELEQLAYGLSPEQWSGDDREAFNKEVGELAQQIGDAELFATIVGYSLVGGTVPLAVWPLGCSIVGVINFVNASLFYAAVASIVGNLGPSEALYASGLATAVTCNRSLSIGNVVLNGLLIAAAVGIAGGAAINVVSQESHGDDAAADLTRATVEMAVEQGVKNLAASGINAISPFPLPIDDVVPGKDNNPVQSGVDDVIGGEDGLAEELGDRAGGVVPGDATDRGPYSGG